ncbi:protein-glutamate O-methyltransferase CheR [Mangrovimicrobium sediminis]|uniref:protein-glutamate O-methyltransferase n=1 Tax=Mangrovimicrobium sediminis TaxID=2562682 RepID=A0A4Z0M7J0_9GAMM|nr:protein-glutamate O-methyltransferase CheR [Haliea sp. SAOS-164]TGD75469.1 protein-glutamate O-methyltransferase CheR [Haliea sp. SAOS-164]
MTYPQVQDSELPEVASFVRSISGIVLDSSKGYLISSRLGPLLQRYEARNYSALCNKAKLDSKLRLDILDAISTNETSFFRDTSPFDLLKFKLIPDLVDRMGGAKQPISIWSAASSTGQEVYSIAISLGEILPNLSQWHIKIMGTDISDAAIRYASAAYYSDLELGRGMSPDRRAKYFTQEGRMWKVRDQYRAMATFRRQNLLDDLTALGKYDIIFCRNVMIYFDMDVRKLLYTKLSRQLKPGGVLVIGSTENLPPGMEGIYKRNDYQRSVFYSV